MPEHSRMGKGCIRETLDSGRDRAAIRSRQLGARRLRPAARPIPATSSTSTRAFWSERRSCRKRKLKVNVSQVFAGQSVGIKEVADRIWLVSFMHYDLGFFDHEACRLEPVANPFKVRNVLPMSRELTATDVSRTDLISLAIPAGFEPATPRLGIWCSIQLSYGTVWATKTMAAPSGSCLSRRSASSAVKLSYANANTLAGVRTASVSFVAC